MKQEDWEVLLVRAEQSASELDQSIRHSSWLYLILLNLIMMIIIIIAVELCKQMLLQM